MKQIHLSVLCDIFYHIFLKYSSLSVCLISGLMRVGTGSTHNYTCLVQNAHELGWF
jgi:hypothetical protein